jgi:hypothetical protein
MTAARIKGEHFKKKAYSMKRVLSCIAASASVLFVTCSSALATGEPFLGQIMLFSGHYCPVDWLPANGQVLPVNSNQALYSIIGNMAGRARIPLRFPMLHLLQH